MSHAEEKAIWRTSIRELLGYTTAVCVLIGLPVSALSQPDTALGYKTRLVIGILWVFAAGGTCGAMIGRCFGCSMRGFWVGIGTIYVISVVIYAMLVQ